MEQVVVVSNSKKKKILGGTVLCIIALLLAVLAFFFFSFAPYFEEVSGGWAFEYEDQLWGLYQFGYPPLGLVNNISLGASGLFQYVIYISEDLAVFNIPAIIFDIVLLLFVILWIVCLAKAAKHKARGAGLIVLSFFAFLLSFLVGIAMLCSVQYIINEASYTYLAISVLMNPEVTLGSRVFVLLAVGFSILAELFVVIALIVGIAKAKPKEPQPELAQAAPQPAPRPVKKPGPAPRVAAPQKAAPRPQK